jgi:2'-5' RNA ligase
VVEGLKRLFLAVSLPSEVRTILAEHLGLLPGKPVPPANWHLTVRFLGNTGTVLEEKVTAALDQAGLGGSFEIGLGEMGAFPKPARATVLWLAIARGEGSLAQLHEIVEGEVVRAGFEPEERPFAPHLTLSRIRPHQDVRPLIAAYQPIPLRWRATDLVLFQSRAGGRVYEPVETFPL